MGNCLVTKLKENVNNGNLVPIGTRNIEVKGDVLPPQVILAQANYSENITIKVVGSGTFSVDGATGLTEYTRAGSITFNVEPPAGQDYITVNVSNWYHLGSIQGNGKLTDTDDLKWTSLEELCYVSLKGKLANLMGKNINRVILTGANTHINDTMSLQYTEEEFVATLRSWPMTLFMTIYSACFDGISAFIYGKAMPDTITEIEMADSNYGSIEDFVDGLRQNRTSGSLVFHTGTNAWTYQGNYVSGNYSLSWTADSFSFVQQN